MVLLLLCLLGVGCALGGAAAALWLVSPPVTPGQRHVDSMARRDRRVHRA